MRRRDGRARWLVASALLLLVAPGCGTSIDSFRPVTRQAQAINGLFVLELILSALLFLLVVGILTYSLVRFRGRPGEPEPPQVHGNRRLEITWTTGAALLLVFLFVMAVRTMAAVEAAPEPGLRIRVIGHRWWWEYQYPDLGAQTATELHVPVGRPLRLEIESVDVVHSFWIPRFGWIRDAVPGKTNVMPAYVEEAGTFDGACTEFCGTQHAWMRQIVVAQPPTEFDAWVQQQRQPAQASSAVAAGQQVFLQSTCVNCHTVAGTPANGTVGPDLTHFGSRAFIASGVLANTQENLERWISATQEVKPGVLMPAYPTYSDEELRALASYLEALK